MMYIPKKVEQLINNLEGISVSDNIKNNNCIVFINNSRFDDEKCVDEINSENYNLEKHILTDGGYYIGNNVTIGKMRILNPMMLSIQIILLEPMQQYYTVRCNENS